MTVGKTISLGSLIGGDAIRTVAAAAKGVTDKHEDFGKGTVMIMLVDESGKIAEAPKNFGSLSARSVSFKIFER